MSLPLDLLPNILGSLDAADLEACTLVAFSFRRIARQFLFTHLVLCARTWEAKCSFLREELGSEFRRKVTKITLKIEELPVLAKVHKVPRPLLLLLQEVGSQLDMFCIEAEREISWDILHPSIREVVVNFLPYIRSLELFGINQIPLLTVLVHFPHLQRLSLQADLAIIGKMDQNDHEENALELSLPGVTSISVNVFAEEDFEKPNSSLAHILTGPNIRSVMLVRSCDDDFLISWDAVELFAHQLHHLSLGAQFYHTVVNEFSTTPTTATRFLDFGLLSQLQSITFTIPDGVRPAEWKPWSNGISRLIMNDENGLYLPSLVTLKFILPSNLTPGKDSSTNLDDIATKSSFEIHIIARSGPSDRGSFFEMVRAFQACLPSWIKAGRLKFWMRV
ncbi:hypothetical protein DL96DRAFT_1581070 [Flagelloscypha sp. PMI_526]|nr:hypothetical protein DL96DRAFT_1581070 [Flagelloscypha sp. PMI_526]